jgi:L-ascorbate metabolism protein UlaG (beta-lactamase superfamily)
MSVQITFLGHAAFLIMSGDHTVAIDPFLTGNPAATTKADAVNATHIVLTHGHADHLGDTPAIANRCGSKVFAAFEICEYLGAEHGVKNLEPGNPGGRIETDFGFVAFTQAFHSSSYEDRYMGQPCGVIINIAGKTIYVSGDTALFSDMRLIGELYKPDLAILCAGDRFTMGPAHAAKAAELVGAPRAIPCHYGTWPLLTSDLSAFKPKGVAVTILESGETTTL